ncbi:MAG: choice-of-anchor M domain-containing protein [Corynebacterium sp.]|nr:choice-of-anchor M domain-containing protein [Corynebacterium sp.]
MKKALPLAAAIMLLASPTASALTLDSGHVDVFNLEYEGSALSLSLHEDTAGLHTEHEPSDVLLRVKDAAYSTDIPAELGISSGYVLPLTQDPNLLWPGWDTTALAASGLGASNIIFNKVSGPGAVYLLTTTGLASRVQPLLYTLDTNEPTYELATNTYIHQAEPAHTHAYWIFSQPGTYTMDVYGQATQAGSPIYSATKTYTWQVGSGDAAAASAERGTAAPAAIQSNPQPAVAPLSGGSSSSGSSASTGTETGTQVATQIATRVGESTTGASTSEAAKPTSISKTAALPDTGSWPLAPFLAFFGLSWLVLGTVLWRWGHRG